jgi:hypothetical protein
MKTNKRAERRRRTANKYKTRLCEIAQAWNGLPNSMTFLKNTPKLCSCVMCGNERKYFKNLTEQEKKAKLNFKEQSKEIS